MEGPDEEYLNDRDIEPDIKRSFQQSLDIVDDGSPLERLVKSISSESEQLLIDETPLRDTSPAALSRTKTYHDPTRPSDETRASRRPSGSDDHDSDDEVNTSPTKRLTEDAENAIASFTSVVFYRYLFGKGFGSFKKMKNVPMKVNETAHEDSHSRTDGSSVPAVGGNADMELSQMTEKAENLPLFLVGMAKSLFAKNVRDDLKNSNPCPLCGNKFHRLTREEVTTRMKALKTGRDQWSRGNFDQLCAPVPEEVYKTELRIEPDGSHSLSESYYRGPRPF